MTYYTNAFYFSIFMLQYFTLCISQPELLTSSILILASLVMLLPPPIMLSLYLCLDRTPAPTKILSIPLHPKNYIKHKNIYWHYLPHIVFPAFPLHFIIKMFKHIAKLKDFYCEFLCIHHLEYIINMLLLAWHI